MATINGTNFNDNNTVNGNGLFHPALVGRVDPGFMIINGLLVFTNDLPDTINGLGGNDIINALGTNDTLNGGSGNDILNGNAGNDRIDGGFGLDVMNGGAGIDTLDVTFWGGAYSLNMNTGLTNFAGETAVNFENVNTGAGNDNILGTAGNNIINTNSGNDVINAGSGNDIVNAGAGNDFVNGGAGADFIAGGAGNDTLTGGANQDSLEGGIGADRFDFNSASESPSGGLIDHILDFNRLQGDQIDLSTIDANVLLAGNQAFAAAQLSYNAAGILTANVLFGADIQIKLVGAPALNFAADIIA